MRNVKGYVFVANTGNSQQIFGKSVQSIYNYEALSTNNITPYKNKKEAIRGSSTFKKSRAATLVQVGSLEMKIAESNEEFEYFKDKESLIVIVSYGPDMNGKYFMGPITQDGQNIGYLPGTYLTRNRFNAFNSTNERSAYERALSLANEAKKQTNIQITIATFNLKFFQ